MNCIRPERVYGYASKKTSHTAAFFAALTLNWRAGDEAFYILFIYYLFMSAERDQQSHVKVLHPALGIHDARLTVF